MLKFYLTFDPKVTNVRTANKSLMRYYFKIGLFLYCKSIIKELLVQKILIMTISERIRHTRQQQKLSQLDLAEKAALSPKSLSRYELGTSIPPADSLKAIANALGVSADYLLDDETVQIKDKDLYKKFEAIQDMKDDETKKMILNFIDLAIRDFQARQAYAS